MKLCYELKSRFSKEARLELVSKGGRTVTGVKCQWAMCCGEQWRGKITQTKALWGEEMRCACAAERGLCVLEGEELENDSHNTMKTCGY